jgi:acyl-CoA synthetase (AMP-forming)/AMP-acid ligase II
VRGASVAAGYHGNAETTAQVFGARLEAEPDARYLRTGDLGTRLDGQLLIVGRLKDTLIVRGRNYYPQDIEETAQQASPALAAGGGAVFQCDERVVLVQELTRQGLRQDDHGAVTDSVRAAIVGRHGIVPHEIVLIKPGQLPRTTSGKVRRAVCRSMYQARAFEPLDATTLLEV